MFFKSISFFMKFGFKGHSLPIAIPRQPLVAVIAKTLFCIEQLLEFKGI